MDIDYIIFKLYQTRVGKGQFPDMQTRYLCSLPPMTDMTKNIDDALRFSESEAKELAFLIDMDYRER